ncbi:hypothetical protein WN944_002147 [Citrus x changshan-huyou]|uniref:F-box domain-containing protein n=1 Tax=Citrus x changshan-huyou TaxID=2935761 RepID=A0AAP0MIJ1_9ROSI
MRTSTGAVRRKGNRRARVVDNEGEDRINALPNYVFSNILTFLPIENVVATSSLSRRWRPVWILVRNLCFNDEVAIGTIVVPGVRLAAFQHASNLIEGVAKTPHIILFSGVVLENWFEFSDHELGWLETENMPPCLTQHVTKIKMEAFTNGKSDL